MLKRKMLSFLLEWKASHGRKCLLINGARQVGKSFIVDRFGEEAYGNYIKLDFVKHPEQKGIFEGSLSAEDVYSRITLFVPGATIEPGQTLIFIDEIQECPAARASFKYLAMDGRCDVVGSGSLLGIRFRELEGGASSLPVGYEQQVTMRPLDFEEYLWARGYGEDAVSALRGYLDRLEPVPQALHQQMMGLLREYMAIGGMPAVVQAFVDGGRDFGVAHA